MDETDERAQRRRGSCPGGSAWRLAAVLALLLFPGVAASDGADRQGAASRSPTAEDAAAARNVVEAFHAELLGSMREADELGFRGRYERMLTALDAGFDLPLMARGALGGTWKELTEQQRSNFLDLSRRLSATRYAENFDGYDDQRFETRSQEPAARRTLTVMTVLVQPKDQDVRFDYRLRLVDGQWRIIDVFLDGMISELTLRRGQYRSLIERKGFAELVKVMESKIEELSGD